MCVTRTWCKGHCSSNAKKNRAKQNDSPSNKRTHQFVLGISRQHVEHAMFAVPFSGRRTNWNIQQQTLAQRLWENFQAEHFQCCNDALFPQQYTYWLWFTYVAASQYRWMFIRTSAELEQSPRKCASRFLTDLCDAGIKDAVHAIQPLSYWPNHLLSWLLWLGYCIKDRCSAKWVLMGRFVSASGPKVDSGGYEIAASNSAELCPIHVHQSGAVYTT